MIKFIYCYRDSKANYFRAPYLDDHDTQEYAIIMQRSLARLDDSKQIELAKDLVCYQLGTFEDETGKITPHEHEIKVFETSDFLKEV